MNPASPLGTHCSSSLSANHAPNLTIPAAITLQSGVAQTILAILSDEDGDSAQLEAAVGYNTSCLTIHNTSITVLSDDPMLCDVA